MVCGNHIIWGFQHVAGFRRRHVGASIQEAWTTSLDGVRAALDADTANDRTLLLRATPRSSDRRGTRCSRRPFGDSNCRRSRPPRRTRWRKQHETNPRSIWGYVQGLTRLSQRTPWQDGRSSSIAPPVASSPRSTDPGPRRAGTSPRPPHHTLTRARPQASPHLGPRTRDAHRRASPTGRGGSDRRSVPCGQAESSPRPPHPAPAPTVCAVSTTPTSPAGSRRWRPGRPPRRRRTRARRLDA